MYSVIKRMLGRNKGSPWQKVAQAGIVRWFLKHGHHEYTVDFKKMFNLHTHSERAQSTVEAAFAIPILMILILLLLQPGIILYDRIIMHSAAAEGCRLLATCASPDQASEDYIRRRLSAVPQIDIFHVHSSGCSWNIELNGNEDSDEVSVKISNEVKPLPLLDSAMAIAGMVNGNGNLKIEVTSTQKTQPEWISSAQEGRDPSSWPGI